MKIQIGVPVYEHYFTTDEVDCINQVWANAAGTYGLDNYFGACLYYSLSKNFTLKNGFENKDFYEYHRYIMKELGCSAKKINLSGHEDNIISIIKEQIEKMSPVIVIFRRNHLLFDVGEDKKSHALQAVLVTGFDKKNFYIRDNLHSVETSITYALTEYRVDKNDFKLYYCESIKECLNTSDYVITKYIYCVENDSACFNNKVEMYSSIIQMFDYSTCKLNDEVHDREELQIKLGAMEGTRQFIKDHIKSWYAICTILGNEHTQMNYMKFIKIRESSLYRLIMNSCKEIKLNPLINKIEELKKRDEHNCVINDIIMYSELS